MTGRDTIDRERPRSLPKARSARAQHRSPPISRRPTKRSSAPTVPYPSSPRRTTSPASCGSWSAARSAEQARLAEDNDAWHRGLELRRRAAPARFCCGAPGTGAPGVGKHRGGRWKSYAQMTPQRFEKIMRQAGSQEPNAAQQIAMVVTPWRWEDGVRSREIYAAEEERSPRAA